jgi:DNA-binding GntR family transcriptional regulator
MIRELVRLCRTECPAFAACAKFAETKPQVTGVLAGQYIPHENGRSLAKAFYAELRHRILQGEFVPGEVMPTEAELRSATGCDWRTVKAAYAALDRAGLIDVRTVGGAIVRVVRASYDADSAA